ncbi:hypothetical protein OG762_26765 [Streptomyces sp. NBC_01136]|uniref:hypothetical protein n=1 Tax=unclassified Streptomyces TaxID=2593676 RepID=UPI003254E459|nr:hypothetical protein OG762_26765 [Streptomyces sp. NBC_01136]
MCSAKSQAVALAAKLTALTGHEAHVEEFPDRIHIRIALPPQLTDVRRRSLLTTLADADRYGHDMTTHGSSLWAEIDNLNNLAEKGS